MLLDNDFGGHLTNWLNRNGYQIQRPPAISFDPEVTGGLSGRDGIRFGYSWQDRMRSLAKRYGTRGRVPEREMDALRILLHEMMHRPLVQREPEWYGKATEDQRLWEEAAAEQAAHDLLPAAAKQLFGYHYQPGTRKAPPKTTAQRHSPERRAREKAYRQWSTLASKSKHYQQRGARVKRREFLNADTATRAQMLASIHMGGPDRPPGV